MKYRSLLAMVVAVAFHLPTPAFSGQVSAYEVIFDDPNVTGAFLFDGNTFSNFIISWGSLKFDITSAANTPPDYDFALAEYACGTYPDGVSSAAIIFERANCFNSSRNLGWIGSYYWQAAINGYFTLEFFTYLPGYLNNGFSDEGASRIRSFLGTGPPQSTSGSTWTVQQIPEPGTYGLMFASLAWLMRKRIAHAFPGPHGPHR